MKKIIVIILGILLTGIAFSQTTENQFQSRYDIKLSLEPIKKFKLSFAPEVRLDESFRVDKYLLESKLSYEPVKGLELGGSYRFIINPRDKKATEYLNRFALSAKYSHKIQRWEPSLRIKYTNYTEDISMGTFLRYRAKLIYNIKNCKINPLASFEAFQELENNQIYKFRYAFGANYKFNKNSSIDLSYSLDYYMQDYLNKHIISIGYNYKF
jgi:hypothetical protein